MIINSNTFYGIDTKEINHLDKELTPLWEKDKNINPITLDVAKYLMIEPYPAIIPKYVFTKTSLEICSKIKINSNSISLIQPQEMINDGIRLTNEWGHISLEREFYRYAVIKNMLFVIHIYKEQDPLKGEGDFIGYSVWRTQLGMPEMSYSSAAQKEEDTKFLQILIFLKYTNPDIKFIESGKKVGTRKNGFFNLTRSSITVVDSTWNTTVVRSKGFSVDGHLRLQPHGPERKQRKLIWIEPFEKEGYVRHSKSENVK